MFSIAARISAIFVMIAMGYSACRMGLVKGEAQSHLTSLILNVNIPCMLLYSITQNSVNSSMMKETLMMLLCSCIYFIVAAAVSIPIVKLFGINEMYSSGVYKIIFTSTNAGFIGFPVIQMLFGREILYFMVLHNIILNLYLYSLCTIQLNGGIRRNISIMNSMRKMINPCIISALISIVFLFAGIRMPEYINNIIGPVGDATIPMAMILIGMQLSEGNISKCITDIRLVMFSIIRLFLWPVAVLAVMVILPMPAEMKITLVVGAALPAASTISALAANEGCDYKLAANGIVITTLFSVISIPCSTLMVHIFCA